VNFVLEDIVAVHLCLLVGCTLQMVPQLQLDADVGSVDTTVSIRNAGVRIRHSTAMGERSGRSHGSMKPLLFSCAETASLPPASPNPDRERRPASLEAVAMSGGGEEINVVMKQT